MKPINDPTGGDSASDNHQPEIQAQNPKPIPERPAESSSPPEPDILNPFAPERLRLNQEHLEQAAGRPMFVTVPIRKPNKQEFIRVHPSEAYRLTPAALIDLQDERETFLVAPEFVPELGEGECYFASLFLAINRQQVISFWPVKLPPDDRSPSGWQVSAMAMARLAMKQWIRVTANINRGAYDYVPARGDWSEPEWPELPFAAILEIAFRDNRIIKSHDHPVIRRLRGVE
jgi:uncharacterized protein YbdZ (MbtH family)